MKHNLKLTLICITALMIICSHFTAMAEINFTLHNGGLFIDTQNPDVPRRNDTLFYSLWTTEPSTDVEITGFRITCSFPDDLLFLSGAQLHGGNYDREKRTITANFNPIHKKIRRGTISSIAEFVTVASAAGTGTIRITGTVTTTNGTFNIDSHLSVTIDRLLPTDPILIIHPPEPESPPTPAVPVEPAPLPEPLTPEEIAERERQAEVAVLKEKEDVVSIPDANLAAAVRKALDLGASATISKQMMQRLTELDATESQIKNLTGLEHATQLVQLALFHNQIQNVNSLEGLTQLQRLYLQDNQITDITPLAKLTQLRRLHLWGNQIRDISVLGGLTKLESLWLESNQIRDISPLTGLTQLTDLKLNRNPIQDTSVLRKLLDRNPNLDLDINLDAGPKIEGPWVWMIASTEGNPGPKAASSGKDWLAAASGGSVTEQQIVRNGAPVGNAVGNKVWTLGRITSTGNNNIAEMVNATGLGKGNYIEYHVAYGSISLDSPREQNTTMYVGSDDSVKVWLNGVLVHNNPAYRGADNYQENFSVTLKQGRNILVVAVYNGYGGWSGFFGFKKDAVYSLAPTSVVHVDAAQRPPLYWIGATTRTLHRLVGDEVENLVPSVRNATDLAMDVAGGKLYWTEKTSDRTGRIRRANLDGTNVKLVKNLTSVPYSIALDTVNGKLYLTNSWGKIQRMNLDGSNFQPNLITGLNAPKYITLDVGGGKMYWTGMGQKLGRIGRANLNGSSVQNIVTNSTEPLTLAVINDKLYFTSGTRENTGELHRASLNGFNHEVLEMLPLAPTSMAVDPARNLLYLTTPTGDIHRRTLDGSGDEPVVTGLVAPSNIVLGITATTPGPTDASEPPATPVVDAATDVNQDQKVNKTDLLLVVTALGESPPANPNFDVNADGSVNIADVLLVIEALDDPVAAAAPSFGETVTSLEPGRLAMQIDILRAESDGSMKYEHAIAFFQSLLASIRPTETQLLANYPNPFNPETWIPYQLATDSNVRITICDARGSVVRVLTLGHQSTGYYTSRSRAAYWDGRNALGEGVASGVYFYQLQADDRSQMRKLLILK